jgi:hypothetical protein
MIWILAKRILLGGIVLGCGSLALPATAVAQTKGPAMTFPSSETERPMSWGLLSRYLAEKSPLGDPIAEASKNLTMAGGVPFRPAPAAYLKMQTPEPFANRHLLRIPVVVPEEAAPPLLLPKR